MAQRWTDADGFRWRKSIGGTVRRCESASHRRERHERSRARVLTALATACLKLSRHHGSEVPYILRNHFKMESCHSQVIVAETIEAPRSNKAYWEATVPPGSTTRFRVDALIFRPLPISSQELSFNVTTGRCERSGRTPVTPRVRIPVSLAADSVEDSFAGSVLDWQGSMMTAAIPLSIRKPWDVFQEDLEDKLAESQCQDVPAEVAATSRAQHDLLITVGAQKAFLNLPKEKQDAYISVSRLELSAYLRWKQAQIQLSVHTGTSMTEQDLPAVWDALEVDDKAEWLPD